MTETIASAPAYVAPLGPTSCWAQLASFDDGSPTNEYLMSVVEMVAWVCQPQYLVRKPLVSVTSFAVRTK